ncbi:histidine phosphatase family protein [bacterium]|nr:histidine phosphatase family protein [bacterium]
MTDIVLVRHGETEFNREGVFRGRYDVGLNDVGREQAEAAAAALARESITAVYSSPLSRAFDTAKAVAGRHGIAPVVDEAFHNIDLGEWQGAKKETVRIEQPDAWALWTTEPERLRIPGGETLEELRARAFPRLEKLAARHDGERVAIVSHRSVIRVLAGAILGMTERYFWRFYMDNAAFSLLRRNGDGYIIMQWNENCHLRDTVYERY